MEICKCGHSKERHVFQNGVCTVRPKNLVGEGHGYCICNQFTEGENEHLENVLYTKDTIESSKVTAAILGKPEGR